MKRRIRRWLSGASRPDPFRRHTAAAEKVRDLLPSFYLGALFIAAFLANELETGPRDLGLSTFLWQVAWIRLTGPIFGQRLIAAAALVSCSAAALWPRRRAARAAAFFSLMQLCALMFSRHSGPIYHAWVLAAFFLIWLPDDEASRRADRHALDAAWAAQTAVLLTYSLAGLAKLVAAAWQLFHGELTCFSPSALAVIVADKYFKTGMLGALGPFVLSHPWAGAAGYYAVLYLQLGSLAVAFRPSLHRFWGAWLVAFHCLTYWTLSVIFPANIWLVGLLFFRSPFADGPMDWTELPLLGLIGPLLTRTPAR